MISYSTFRIRHKRLNSKILVNGMFRIFLASQFLIDSLRTRARLADRNFEFRIPYSGPNILFETITKELVREFTVAAESVKRRQGKKQDEEILDEGLMENRGDDDNGHQGKHSSLIRAENQSVNRTELQNSDVGGTAHDQVYRGSLDLDEGAVFGSGSRDDLWEVVTVQARVFQELADEVVCLRDEIAQLKMKGRLSKDDAAAAAADVVTGLKEEVARLQRRDKMREFEAKTKFREMEDKLVFFQEEIMKMFGGRRIREYTAALYVVLFF
ncbi:hypothetical protein BGZ97_007892 [Linnemannia gamsii]|uniref:Uncharacterized protein n=1 Tax=Linnemannia gamsii TaxID=64522 RepID=A0A9P6QQ72_9FUNG|nr:hypothetical protein BGZ97_007892 [Linnemannia gamsii]